MKRAAESGDRGFALINALIAALIFALALLGLAGLYTRFTITQTQNQNLIQLAPWSNSFWGIAQANPNIWTSMSKTYNSANITDAPAILQPWLSQLLNTTTSPAALPGATVVITTGPDAATGSACSSDGCSVQITVSWSQNGNTTNGGNAMSRSQTFNYQFGHKL